MHLRQLTGDVVGISNWTRTRRAGRLLDSGVRMRREMSVGEGRMKSHSYSRGEKGLFRAMREHVRCDAPCAM